MSGRVYERKFDWDEAIRLRDAGLTIKEIASRMGVTSNAVYRVVKPGELERQAEQHKAWQASGHCDGCGGPMNRLSRSHGSRLCRRCHSDSRITTARERELRCQLCHEWKADDEFPRNSAESLHRRGRHGVCRSCQTIARREHRRRNREAARAYDRAYKARRRAEARTQAVAEEAAKPKEGDGQSVLSS